METPKPVGVCAEGIDELEVTCSQCGDAVESQSTAHLSTLSVRGRCMNTDKPLHKRSAEGKPKTIGLIAEALQLFRTQSQLLRERTGLVIALHRADNAEASTSWHVTDISSIAVHCTKCENVHMMGVGALRGEKWAHPGYCVNCQPPHAAEPTVAKDAGKALRDLLRYAQQLRDDDIDPMDVSLIVRPGEY